MTGTVKQIAWAEKIKAEALETFDRCRAEVKRFEDMGYPKAAPYVMEDINSLETATKKFLGGVTEASEIINKRDRLSEESLCRALEQNKLRRENLALKNR